MDLLTRFRENWQQQFRNITPANSALLLAVSGGVDSIVLADLLYQTGFDFVIAHCNFQLRGEESEQDEAFVKSLGEKYKKSVLTERFETAVYAEQNKVSIQVAARELRYTWFAALQAEQAQPCYLLTAHQANDQVETVLMNLGRGTGIEGLTGIPAFVPSKKMIRPLLFAKRTEILAYAQEKGLQWREDASNISDKYSRNYFRHHIIPAFQKVYVQAEENILGTVEHLQEAATLYKQAVDVHKKKLLEYKGEEVHIPVLKLKKTVPLKTVLWEIISEYGFKAAQTDEIIKLTEAENGSYVASSSHQIIKNRAWLIIAPAKTEAAAHVVIEERDTKIPFGIGAIILHQSDDLPKNIPTENNVACIDATLVQFPMLLRKWKQGDYFYPLGMQKKKKVSRFLIDLKLSKTEKENVWVLEMNKKIIWVVGYRIDNRFRLTDATKKMMQFTYRK
ncbi:MAG: tRNA lysidine(34) synthetase TilS [Bacteroidota bacterium]|nr:tRNA lysidine(34) synthetase TilS [Bacteroidota bacterium]